MTELIQLVKDVGFPIFVAIFLLYKDSNEKKETRTALTNLTTAIEKLQLLITVDKED